MNEKINKPKDEAIESKLSLIQAVGLAIFIAGLVIIIAMYFASAYSSSIFLIGFSIGLVMIALGGGLVIVYENKVKDVIDGD